MFDVMKFYLFLLELFLNFERYATRKGSLEILSFSVTSFVNFTFATAFKNFWNRLTVKIAIH